MAKIAESEILSALSEPTRLRVAVLLTRGELCVCNLVEILDLPQSTVSRHMARLRRASMVLDRREGRWVHYRLNESDDSFWKNLMAVLTGLTSKVPFSNDLAELERSRIQGNLCQPSTPPDDAREKHD